MSHWKIKANLYVWTLGVLRDPNVLKCLLGLKRCGMEVRIADLEPGESSITGIEWFRGALNGLYGSPEPQPEPARADDPPKTWGYAQEQQQPAVVNRDEEDPYVLLPDGTRLYCTSLQAARTVSAVLHNLVLRQEEPL